MFIICLISAISFSINGYGQINLRANANYIKPDKTFQRSSKSKKIEMKKGDTYTLNLKLKENRTYYISVAGERALGDVQYRIIEKGEEETVLYDNSVDEFQKSIIITSDSIKQVVVEIVTQPDMYKRNNKDKSEIEFLYAYKRT